MSGLVFDRTFRRVPGGWEWWRVHVSVTLLRGTFESGTGWTYRGLIHRWARRIGPVNVALLRLIGEQDEPYRTRRTAPPDPHTAGQRRTTQEESN